jgi:ring-1,2-phenylacetyl-CoA epoxidase subunit PaaE
VVHFHQVEIKEIRKETKDCVSIAFDIPLHLHEVFKYQQGQYVTLRAYIKNQEVRRSYSLCSSPLENEWRIAVKKVQGGLFSTYANEDARAGDTIDLMPPMGKFYTSLDESNKKEYVAIAAGSGITPVISIIKTTLAIEKSSRFTLIYGNRNRASIIFKEEIEGLKNKYIDRFRVIHILSREITDAEINTGKIDLAKCSELFTKHVEMSFDEFFICGPEEMLFCVRDFLLGKGVAEKKIHFELFTAPQKDKKKTFHLPQEEGEERSKITIKRDGIAFHFFLAPDENNILDAALHSGADLPYSCKGGVCSTCRAKVTEGKVEMETNYALEPDEVAAGFILTCQSHPATKEVVVDFDIK